MRRGLAFHRRVHGEDDFFHPVFGAGDERRHVEPLRRDAVKCRQGTAQNVITALEHAGPFQRPQIGNVFHHAKDAGIAARIAAQGARRSGVEIAANLAGLDRGGGLAHRVDQIAPRVALEAVDLALAAVDPHARGQPLPEPSGCVVEQRVRDRHREQREQKREGLPADDDGLPVNGADGGLGRGQVDGGRLDDLVAAGGDGNAGVDEPSPFTRVGLGVNRAVKPDLVYYGGNLLFEGVGNQYRRVRTENPDAGVAVMSFSHQPLDTLFSFRVGTSQAAPPVARMSAMSLDSSTGPGSRTTRTRTIG